jgi:3-hydroxyacyl-CoA dehydrogenase
MNEFSGRIRVAVVGAGLIGASWVATFLAQGWEVAVYDPTPAAEAQLRNRLDIMWLDLRALHADLPATPPMTLLKFSDDIGDAVREADVVQESIPEDLEAKIALYAQLDVIAPAHALLLSSTSALRMSDIQRGCKLHPERCVVGHPFNPPHLIPLVEVVGGARTSAGAIARALAFYRAAGKHPVHIHKEIAGHVANRLQAALMREVVDLIEKDVIDVAGVDDIARFGPGLRWALLGPVMIAYLGNPEHRRPTFPAGSAQWSRNMWDNVLSTPSYGPETQQKMAEGIGALIAKKPAAQIEAERDRALIELLRLVHPAEQ